MVSVYLPDELYRAAQERKLPLSALTRVGPHGPPSACGDRAVSSTVE